MAKKLKATPIKENTWFSNELRKQAKAANERMREMERKGITSPAYLAVQAQMEAMGIKPTKAGKRRFSETGKGSFNQLEALNKVVNKFLEQKTSTAAKAQAVNDKIWNTAEQRYDLSKHGITKKQWGEIWKNLPDKAEKNGRNYGSTVYIEMVETALRKQREALTSADPADRKEISESQLSIEDIVNIVNCSKDVKSMYGELGITWQDVKTTRNLGKL